jgi:hypothetical protein
MLKMLQLHIDHFVAFGLSVIGHQLSVHNPSILLPDSGRSLLTFPFHLLTHGGGGSGGTAP